MTHPIELLGHAVVMAAFALGMWVAIGPGMIFGVFSRLADRLSPWIAKPLATCPRCMCSFWGIVALLLLGADVGIETNLSGHRLISDGFGKFVVAPMISIAWERLLEVPALIVLAVGIQELLHRN